MRKRLGEYILFLLTVLAFSACHDDSEPAVHKVDVNTQIVEEASDEDKTMPPIYANDQNKEGNRRTRFTPMNIGLAVVALVAVCSAIWFAVGNVEVNVEVKQYRAPELPVPELPLPTSEPCDVNEDEIESEPVDTTLLDGPQAVVEPTAVKNNTLKRGLL